MLLRDYVRAIGFCAAAAACAAAGAEATLEEQFAQPPQNATRASVGLTLESARGDAEAFARQLERAREAGAGGVLVAVPTADDAVWGLLAKGADRCRQLGLELGVRDFGMGTQEVASAAHTRRLVWSSFAAGASDGTTNALPQVFQTDPSYQELARLAVPVAESVQPHEIADLTQGPLPTNGAWRVFQFGHADAAPPMMDCFDERQVSRHVNGLLVAFQKRLERTYGTTFLWYQMQGFEGMESLWPRDLAAVFLKRSGLGLLRHLPALAGVTVGDEATAAHVRQQIAQAVRELWRGRYASQVNELVHEAGLDAGIAINGLPVDPEEVALYFKRPLLSPARSEAQHAANVRAAGGARTMGRRYVVGRVDTASVAPTTAQVLLPFPCKHEVDRLLSDGATRILFETGGTLPGDERFAALRDACRYAHRCQVILQQGEAAADFLVWSQEPLPELDGYGCDYANQAMLETAVAKEGRIRFDSERTYGALAVSAEVLKSKAAQRLARHFEARGVKVWVAGGGPEASGNGGAEPVGKPLRAAADGGVVRDFAWRSEVEAVRVRFLHRRTQAAEFYFVANTAEAGGPVSCTFRDTGKGVAERWDPATGEIDALPPGGRAADGRLTVSVFLAPHDACFIVFDR